MPVPPFLPQTLTATISNNQNVMALAKYAVGPLKLYAGYEWYQLAPPSDPVNTVTGFSNIGGLAMGTAYNNLTAISNVAFSAGCGTGTCSDKIMQVMWTGARYAVTKDLDVVGAYYHYIQNTYTTASCANPTAHSQCGGTFDAVSALGRLAISAEVGCLYRYDVLASECRSLERLSRSQQPRSDSRCSLPVLTIAAGPTGEYVLRLPPLTDRSPQESSEMCHELQD